MSDFHRKMNTQKDFYQILEVSRDAPLSTIKAKYRELSKKYHPDKGGNDNLAFQKVKEAYETLSNPKTRKEYDDGLRGSVVSDLRTTTTVVVNRFFQGEFGR